MTELLAFISIILWPVIPLFWIPVHGLSKIFKRLGLLTYIMPLITWLPLAYLIYQNRIFILQYKIDVPVTLKIIGIILLTTGTLLHIWTGKLLGPWGLVGLPEISAIIKSRFVKEGPFSVVRHPTYLAHTLMFSGIFLMTEVLIVFILTLLDFILINLLIIPLEERELSIRFGEEYRLYIRKVPRFFPRLLKEK
ncbi:MAG: isoprenylcysteine carboxylmethyltransferase family protein [Nitrospirota bacterium]